jgi:hypothetical protein
LIGSFSSGNTDGFVLRLPKNVSSLPTASLGSGYVVTQGDTLQLAATATDAQQAGDTLTYQWDLNNDGIFGETGSAATRGDETGMTPTFSAAGLIGPSTYPIALRVTDAYGLSTTVTGTIQINPPAIALSASGPENAGALNRGSLPSPIPYSLAGAIGPTGTSKWTQPNGLGTPVYISYSFSNLLDGTLAGGLSTNQIRAAAEQAMAIWSAAAPLVFVEVPDSGPDPRVIGNNDYPATGYPMIRIGQRTLTTDIALTNQPNSATSGQSGDINLNTSPSPTMQWSLDPAQGYDLRQVFLHELGLALGLNESPAQPASIMAGYDGRFTGNTPPQLNTLDIQAIQGVYGSSQGAVYSLFPPAIVLPIAQAPLLSGLTLTGVTIFDVPAGATLSAGTNQGNGTWLIAPYQLNGLMLAPPANYHGNFTLPFTAYINDGTTRQGNVAVSVAAVAYAPNLVVNGTAQGDAGTPIHLPVQASFSVPTDSDGVLTLVVSGVPASATVTGGTSLGNGAWSVDPANIYTLSSTSGGFTITPALGSPNFSLQLTATDTQISNNASVSTTLTLPVTVIPIVPDAFEPYDNAISGAVYLQRGVVQSHSIAGPGGAAGDVDWYTFNVLRDNSEINLRVRSPHNAATPLAANLVQTLYTDAQGTLVLAQTTGDLAVTGVLAGQYWLSVQDAVPSGVANYTIQLGISDPSAITPILVGTAVPSDTHAQEPDYYDDPSHGFNDNALGTGVPVLVPGNQLDGPDGVWRAIYAVGDVDWSQFTIDRRSVLTLQAYVPEATPLTLFGNATTGSSTIVINASDASLINQLAVGMTVTSPGTIHYGTTIVSIQATNHSFTLSQNPIANNSQAKLDFQMNLAGSVAAGSTAVTGIPNTSHLAIGMYVFGTGIPANSTITSISSDNHSITLSNIVTLTQTGDLLTFVPLPPIICLFDSSHAQVANTFDPVTSTPSVQSKFSATLDSGNYYALVYYYNNGGVIPRYDLNLSIADAPDTTPPVATIGLAASQSSPTNASTVAFVAQFSKPVTGLTGAGIVLPSGVFASVSPVNATNGYATTYSILATGITSSGSVNIGLAAVAVRDASGNANVALSPSQPIVVVDKTPPTATIVLAAGQSAITFTPTVSFSLQFSESMHSFDASNLLLTGNATAGTLATIAPGSANSYIVTVTGLTTPGTLTLGLKASITDLAGNALTATPTASVTYNINTALAGEYLFYKGSSFDTGNAAAALATDKTPLFLPSGSSSIANYTSYDKGINGLMVDITGAIGTISASDFVFKVGNTSNTNSWTTAPAPVSVIVRPGAGVNESSRIEIIWVDGAIAKEWLQIAVLANNDTGLAANEVFYFGNAVGDSGNSASDYKVTAADEIFARVNATPSASITNYYDYNRDGVVNAADELVAQNNLTNFATALVVLESSSGSSLAQGAASGVSGSSSTIAPVIAPPVSTPLGPTSDASAASTTSVAVAQVSFTPAATVSNMAAVVPVVNAPSVANASTSVSPIVPVIAPPVSTPAEPATAISSASSTLVSATSASLTLMTSVSNMTKVVPEVNAPPVANACGSVSTIAPVMVPPVSASAAPAGSTPSTTSVTSSSVALTPVTSVTKVSTAIPAMQTPKGTNAAVKPAATTKPPTVSRRMLKSRSLFSVLMSLFLR